MSQFLALFFLTLTLVEMGGLAWLAPLDAAVMQWIIAQRSCASDYAMFIVRDRPLVVLTALGVVACLWLCLRQRWQEALRLIAVVMVGAFLCELLKTGIERVRPSALPLLTTGNSFPSGHVTTACLIAGALGFAVRQEHHRRALIPATVFGVTGLLAGVVIW